MAVHYRDWWAHGEARIRDRHVTFNYCKKAAELAAFLLFSKCRRGFLLRGFRDPPLPATPVRLGSRTHRPFHLAGGSVPRVREHVVGSDLLLAYPLCASSKHSLPWGACGGRKGEAVQAATVGTTR